MKKIFKYMSVALASAALTGCSDFLDKKDPSLSSEGYFQTELGLSEATNAVYVNLGMNGDWAAPLAIEFDNWSPYGMIFREATVGLGSGYGIRPDNGSISQIWSEHYRLIARANSVIDGAKDVWQTMSEASQRKYNECRVLRAYGYVTLLSTFGDVLFVTAPVQTDQYTLAPTDKTVIMDWLLQELEEAAEYLPWTPEQRGRVTKAFAYGLEARAALIAAGFNYGGKATDYYKIARDASKKVIDSKQYDLAKDYTQLYTQAGQATADVQKELILELMFMDDGKDIYQHYGFFGSGLKIGGQATDATYRMPTSLIVDIFEDKDGFRIDESKIYNPKRPYLNRDPRMRHTLVMHGDTISYSADQGITIEQVIVNCYDNKTRGTRKGRWREVDNLDVQNIAANSYIGAGVGYGWRKYVDDMQQRPGWAVQNISLMRYAEVLLTYAEAKIELNELDNTVYDAINKVRNRVKMPNFEKAHPERIGNQDLMRQIVRRERKAELAWEGLLFTDYRRWDIGDLLMKYPLYGYPIESIRYSGLDEKDIPNYTWSGDGRSDMNDVPSYEAYKKKLNMRAGNRAWQNKYRYFPYPQGECNKNPNLVNKDW